MNARTAVAALAVLAALTLTGCAATSESPAGDGTGPGATESAAPLEAETTEPTAETTNVDEQFLTDVRKALTNGRETTIPNATDEQLIEAGHAACEQLAAGTDQGAVHVVDGEKPDDMIGQYPESFIIAGVATGRLC